MFRYWFQIDDSVIKVEQGELPFQCHMYDVHNAWQGLRDILKVYDTTWMAFHFDLLRLLRLASILRRHLTSRILLHLQVSPYIRPSLQESNSPWQWQNWFFGNQGISEELHPSFGANMIVPPHFVWAGSITSLFHILSNSSRSSLCACSPVRYSAEFISRTSGDVRSIRFWTELTRSRCLLHMSLISERMLKNLSFLWSWFSIFHETWILLSNSTLVALRQCTPRSRFAPFVTFCRFSGRISRLPCWSTRHSRFSIRLSYYHSCTSILLGI